MPFRFRRSIKIFPGVKLNISKGGISTSFGGHGHSINIGKQGIHQNVGIPGTGLSYRSTVMKAPKIPVGGNSKGSASQISDRLVPINKPNRRRYPIWLIILGIFTGILLCSVGSYIIVDFLNLDLLSLPTQTTISTLSPSVIPTPTITLMSSIIFTETITNVPTSTSTPTIIFMPTPTFTFTFTITSIPTKTRTPLPYVPPTPNHPPGTSGRCKDGTYTSAVHRQGACSSHDGIAEWWGP
jgi:hypothetical protein